MNRIRKRSKANEGRSWKGKKKVKCTHCDGSGYHGTIVCPECNGSGFVKHTANKGYALDQKPDKADYVGELFKVENWMPD